MLGHHHNPERRPQTAPVIHRLPHQNNVRFQARWPLVQQGCHVRRHVRVNVNAIDNVQPFGLWSLALANPIEFPVKLSDYRT